MRPIGSDETTKEQKVICFGCYGLREILSEYTLGITRLAKIPANYKILSVEEKIRVPDTYYLCPLATMKGRRERGITGDVKND